MNILLLIACGTLIYFAISKGWIKLNSTEVSQLLRTMGGYALVGAALTMALTGKFIFALPLGLAGLWLLGVLKIPGFWNFNSAQSQHQRTQLLDVSIDPVNGTVSGQVTAGPFAGRPLASLNRDECLALAQDLNARDQIGLRLFVIYLDCRFPGWREHLQGGADARMGRQSRTHIMTDQEAYQILGLASGASETAIREAHRKLMLKLHPDVGGSTSLATLVNEAKDTLLRRHH